MSGPEQNPSPSSHPWRNGGLTAVIVLVALYFFAPVLFVVPLWMVQQKELMLHETFCRVEIQVTAPVECELHQKKCYQGGEVR